jgi:RimJ/RimL family protein N-acetyltransferase
VKLVPVGKEKKAVVLLYKLLEERPETVNISHKSMPTLDEHRKFVESHPYQYWALIQVTDHYGPFYVGAVYITKLRELGIFIFKEHQGKGYAKEALEKTIAKWPGRFLANVAPQNEKSINLFTGLGFKRIQSTYEWRP